MAVCALHRLDFAECKLALPSRTAVFALLTIGDVAGDRPRKCARKLKVDR